MVESVRGGKSGRGWSQSSSVEFDAKLLANNLALSDDEVIISGPLMMVGIGGLPRLRIRLVILQNSRDPSCSSATLALTDSA